MSSAISPAPKMTTELLEKSSMFIDAALNAVVESETESAPMSVSERTRLPRLRASL